MGKEAATVICHKCLSLPYIGTPYRQCTYTSSLTSTLCDYDSENTTGFHLTLPEGNFICVFFLQY